MTSLNTADQEKKSGVKGHVGQLKRASVEAQNLKLKCNRNLHESESLW